MRMGNRQGGGKPRRPAQAKDADADTGADADTRNPPPAARPPAAAGAKHDGVVRVAAAVPAVGTPAAAPVAANGAAAPAPDAAAAPAPAPGPVPMMGVVPAAGDSGAAPPLDPRGLAAAGADTTPAAAAPAPGPAAAPAAANPRGCSSHGSLRRVGSKRGPPSLDLTNVAERAAAFGPAVPLTARGSQHMPVMQDGILLNEQHRKEAKLMEAMWVCSSVTPWLFVSGEKVSSDLATLRSHGITCVVNCADGTCATPHEADGMLYLALPLHDSPGEEVIPHFYTVIETIERVRLAGGRTLVHCHQGVSRSGTFVIAYLMWAFGLGWEAAQDAARNCRSTISPNPGFLCQLMEWEAELRSLHAHHVTASARHAPDGDTATATATATATNATEAEGATTVLQPVLCEVLPSARQAWMSAGLASLLAADTSGAGAGSGTGGGAHAGDAAATASPPPSMTPSGTAGRGASVAPTPPRVRIPYTVQVVRTRSDRTPVVPTVDVLDPKRCYVVRVPVAPSSSAASTPAHGLLEDTFVWVGRTAAAAAGSTTAAVDMARAEALRWYRYLPAPLLPGCGSSSGSASPTPSPFPHGPVTATPSMPPMATPPAGQPVVVRQGVEDAKLLAVLAPAAPAASAPAAATDADGDVDVDAATAATAAEPPRSGVEGAGGSHAAGPALPVIVTPDDDASAAPVGGGSGAGFGGGAAAGASGAAVLPALTVAPALALPPRPDLSTTTVADAADAAADAAGAASDVPPLHRRGGADAAADEDDDAALERQRAARPTLHKWLPASSSWEPVPVFDDDDLEPDGVFVALPGKVAAVDGQPLRTAFVWVGEDTTLPQDVVSVVPALAADQGVTIASDVTVVAQGEEPEAFWELFD